MAGSATRLLAHSRPGGPSSGLTDRGGDIVGRVCGTDLHLAVTHAGDHALRIGFVDNAIDAPLEVAGAIGRRSVALPVERIGRMGRVFATLVEGDRRLRIPAAPATGSALASLPAADRGVLLRTIVLCVSGNPGNHSEADALTIRFGGEQGDAPPHSSGLSTC